MGSLTQYLPNPLYINILKGTKIAYMEGRGEIRTAHLNKQLANGKYSQTLGHPSPFIQAITFTLH